MITIEITFSKAGVCTTMVWGTGISNATAKARGCGYSKDSAAAAEALNEAGVQLPNRAKCYGYDPKKGFKTGGVGMSAILEPFRKAGFCIISREVSKSSAIHIIFKKSEVRNGYFI